MEGHGWKLVEEGGNKSWKEKITGLRREGTEISQRKGSREEKRKEREQEGRKKMKNEDRTKDRRDRQTDNVGGRSKRGGMKR